MSTMHDESVEGPARSVRRSAGGVLAMLLGQFLVGMAVNLIGVPEEASEAAKVTASIFLGLHLLIAAGLLAGAVAVLPRARRLGTPAFAMAWRGFGAVFVACAAGVLDLLSGSDWWSYLMAASATASLLFYGLLFLRASRPG